MSVTDQLVENNGRFVATFDKGDKPMPPARKVAVVACMDARLHVSALLGLDIGDAHIIRNAGGVVSDDAVRSLAISQRLLGTNEIILIHHTDCGMLTFRDDDVKAQIEVDTGIRPSFALEAFTDVEEDVRQSIAESRRARSSRTATTFGASSRRHDRTPERGLGGSLTAAAGGLAPACEAAARGVTVTARPASNAGRCPAATAGAAAWDEPFKGTDEG